MGHQIVKQPDGRLAVFSDGVDAWIVWDATPEEIVEYYAERAAESARVSARRTVAAVMEDRAREAYYQFTRTFAELNAVHKATGQTEGPEGPVDQETLREWEEQRAEFNMDMKGHLMHGAEDDAP
jgi:hypothetical protein